MTYKKYTLAGLHIVLSLLLGYVLSSIRLFESLFAPTTDIIIVGLLAVFAWYSILFINFLFSFANQKKIVLIYAISSFSFGIVYFVSSLNILFSVIIMLLYFVFLVTTQHMALKREKLFVRFSVNAIFLPIVRRDMFFLLILFAIVGYVQARVLHNNTASTTQKLLQIFVKPVSYALNKQVNTQIASQHTSELQQLIGHSSKAMVSKVMLEQTVEFLDPTWTKKYLGIEPQSIPIAEAIIDDDGTIDVSPVVTGLIPHVAQHLDQTYSSYIVYVPLVLAILVVVLLQPFFYIVSFLLSLSAPLALYILFKSGFLIKETVQVEKETVRL